MLVAPQVLSLIDADGDGEISEAEGQAYARAVLGDVRLGVDQHREPLILTTVELPPVLSLKSGLGTIRFEAAAESDGPPIQAGPGAHQVFFENANQPVKSAYQVNVDLGRDGGIDVARVRRDELQQTMRVDYTVAPPGRVDPGPTGSKAAWLLGGIFVPQGWLVDVLSQPALSPVLFLLALTLSATLGGLHALTPGHGKTLLASYLVGSRGTARHAVFLGGAVTFTHTASVIALGLLALRAGQLVVPSLVLPALELASGCWWSCSARGWLEPAGDRCGTGTTIATTTRIDIPILIITTRITPTCVSIKPKGSAGATCWRWASPAG